jgi:signal transduction histidine kinase
MTARKPVISPFFVKAEAFAEAGRKDSAFYYFNQVVQKSKDSFEIGQAYYNMAYIQIEAGDYIGAQDNVSESLKHLNEKKEQHHYYIFSNYTVLGNSFYHLKNYDAAISYYDRALKFASTDDLRIYVLNGKALVLGKKREYAQAVNIYRSIIDKSLPNKKEYARILSNLALAHSRHDSRYNALPELLTALQIRTNENDTRGMITSYAHLSDYYSTTRPDSALFYAQKMYALAKRNNSADDQLEAIERLTQLDQSDSIRAYSAKYYELNDSIQIIRNNAKTQFAVLRFESKQTKADNLILQKQNAEKEAKLFKQQLLMYAAIAAIIAITVTSILWARKRKQRLQLEAQNAIRENQLKTSQKVHDVVANGLYKIMTELEHQPVIQKEKLIDKIDVLYEKSRDISYEQPESAAGGFHQTVANLLMPFGSGTTKVLIVGNNPELWHNINSSIQKQLEPILQELMVNMKKHSHAKNVVVKFQKEGSRLVVSYQDDGVGLAPSFQPGNGLKNTENRIKAAGGELIFDLAPANGLKIRMSFPIT